SAERVTLAVGEVAKRHLETAADLRIEAMHCTGEAVGRQPLRHGIRFGEGAIDLLRLRRQNAVQSNGARHGSFLCVSEARGARPRDAAENRAGHETRTARVVEIKDTAHELAGGVEA